jgi:hypothetical protein
MILPGTYQNGFAPRDGEPLFPELWDGCVGAWNPGLGPSGLTLRDWSPYKNHGTLTNMVTSTGWRAKKGGYSLELNGLSNFIDLGQRAWFADRPYSFSLYFSVNNPVTFQLLVGKDVSGSRDFALNVSGNSPRKLAFGDFGSGAAVVGVTDIQAERVYHVACIRRSVMSNGFEMYLDGKLEATGTANQSLTIVSQLRLGAREFSGFNQFQAGQNGEFAVYDRPLSTNEIRLLASRRGIAYELAPRGWTQSQIAAYRARYYSQLIGGGVI